MPSRAHTPRRPWRLSAVALVLLAVMLGAQRGVGQEVAVDGHRNAPLGPLYDSTAARRHGGHLVPHKTYQELVNTIIGGWRSQSTLGPPVGHAASSSNGDWTD